MNWGLLALLLAMPIATQAAEGFRRLTGRQIAERFTGMELTDDVHWTYTFKSVGHMTSFVLGKPETGSWRIDNDQLCFGTGALPARCYDVWMAQNAIQLRRDDELPVEAMLQKPAK